MVTDIIHKIVEDKHTVTRWVYMCNEACNITVSKGTQENNKVTCKNCLRGLNLVETNQK